MVERSPYIVQGNVVEHTAAPRFQAIVSVHDGQTAGIRLVEWVDPHRHITELHAKYLMAIALLAWSLQQPAP